MDKNKAVKLYRENLHEISGENVTIEDEVKGEPVFVSLQNGGIVLFEIEFNKVLTPNWREKAANRILYTFYEIMKDKDLFPAVDNWLQIPNYCSDLKGEIKTCIVKRSFRKKSSH